MSVISIREVFTATRFPPHRLIAGKISPMSFRNLSIPANRVAPCCKTPTVLQHIEEHVMRKFHSIAALRGDGLRPELQALFVRLDIDPGSELFVRDDGMHQAGPDPASETAFTAVVPLTKRRG
jgi:hypothetical protein